MVNHQNYQNNDTRDFFLGGLIGASPIAPSVVSNEILKKRLLDKKIKKFKEKYSAPYYDYDATNKTIKLKEKSLKNLFETEYKEPYNWNKYTRNEKDIYINNNFDISKLKDLEDDVKDYTKETKKIISSKINKRGLFRKFRDDVRGVTNDIKVVANKASNILNNFRNKNSLATIKPKNIIKDRPLKYKLQSLGRLSIPVATTYAVYKIKQNDSRV